MTVDLVPESAAKRIIVPTSATQVGEGWKSDVLLDDSSWLSASGAPGGVGYERSSGYEDFISLNVQSQMYSHYTTCYIRIPFSVSSELKTTLSGLHLSIRYDDGFVAYLNGEEVGRTGFTGTPQWNSAAESDHEASSQNSTSWRISPTAWTCFGGRQSAGDSGTQRLDDQQRFYHLGCPDRHDRGCGGRRNVPYTEDLKLLDNLRVTELMYNPPLGDRFEYIELQNVGGRTLDLTGVRFVEGIQFTFPSMPLASQEYVVVAGDPAAFRSAYGSGINVAGQYTGRLSNGGEGIVLALPDPLEAAIARFHYHDDWYPATDGGGKSLAILDPPPTPPAGRIRRTGVPPVPLPASRKSRIRLLTISFLCVHGLRGLSAPVGRQLDAGIQGHYDLLLVRSAMRTIFPPACSCLAAKLSQLSLYLWNAFWVESGWVRSRSTCSGSNT